MCHLTCSLAFGIELSLLEQCKELRVVDELLELGERIAMDVLGPTRVGLDDCVLDAPFALVPCARWQSEGRVRLAEKAGQAFASSVAKFGIHLYFIEYSIVADIEADIEAPAPLSPMRRASRAERGARAAFKTEAIDKPKEGFASQLVHTRPN